MILALTVQLQDPDKVKARSARFGIEPPSAPAAQTQASRNKRQAIASDPVDAAEEERRRKRAARFGLGGPIDPAEDEQRKNRAARFGLEVRICSEGIPFALQA